VARYRKIDVKIWNDEKFIAFSDDGKLAFLFVLTHPHLTALGAMRGTLAGLSAELRWSPRRFRAALAPAIRAGMIEVNEQAGYIGLPRFLRYNKPESPNVVKSAWLECLNQIPECPEKRGLVLRCRKYLDDRSDKFKGELPDSIWEAFSEALPEGVAQPSAKPFGKASGNPEPEQEQEQKPESPLITSSLGSGNGHDSWPSPAALVALWNQGAPPECPRVQDLSDGRRRLASEALRKKPDQAFWESAIDEIRRSSFLRGLKKSPGHEHWRATFDWFLGSKDKTENYVRVAEGAYRDLAAADQDFSLAGADDDGERYPYFSTCRTCGEIHQEGIDCPSATASR
jgi:hypothetical protein